MMWELKLENGKKVEWEGETGEDAARRYVDMHREDRVVATREARSERYGIWPWGGSRIIEGSR